MKKNKNLREQHKDWKIDCDDKTGIWTAEHDITGQVITNKCYITLKDILKAME